MHILTLPAHAPKHSRCPLALKPLRRPLLQALALLGLGLGSIDDAQAATITWSNSTANWNAGASWVGGLAPTGTSLTDELVFGGSSAYTATNNFTTGTALPAFYLNRMTFTNTANVTVNATGTYPANIPLRFGGSSPQMTFSGAGTKAFVNSINLGSGQSLSATIASGSGQVTFGQNTGAAGSPLIGTGTMTITNNSATTAQIFTFSQNFQGTLNLAGGNFKTSDLGGALFGLHMTLDVAAGATFDFANEEEDLGAITGGGTVKLGALSFRTDRFFAEGDHLFSGSFQGSGSITARAGLAGSGTTTWSGNNSFAGAFALENGTLKLADGGRISGATSFTISNGATVLIDDSTQSTDIVRTNVNPTALAGNYTWLGRDNAARAETLGAVTIQTSAASKFTLTPGAGTSSLALTMSSLARAGRGSFVDFAGPSATATFTITTAPTLVGGIIGYATRGDEWATMSGSSVVALGTYQTNTDPTTWVATDNVKVSAAPIAPVGTRTINSLNLTSNQTVDVGVGNTLTLTAGGILASSSATITGGTLVANQAANQELAIVVNGAGNALTIASVIDDASPNNGLLKTGDGTLILTGTNLYNQGTRIYGGTLQISSDANLGAASGEIFMANGTLKTTASITSLSRVVTLSGRNNIFDVAAGTTLAFTASGGSIQDTDDSGGFTKIGGGTLAADAGQRMQGPITINAGTFRTLGGSGPDSLGSSGVGVSQQTTMTIASGAIFDDSFSNFGEDIGTLAGAGEFRYLAKNQGGLTLFADPKFSVTTTFSGLIRSFQSGVATTSYSSGSDVNFGFGPASAVINGQGGTITLTGASDYVGKSIVNYGTVRLGASVLAGSAGPLGNPAASERTILLGNTANNNRTNGALLLSASGVTLGRAVTVRDASTAGQAFGIVTLGSDHATGTSTISGAITLGRSIEFTVAGTATTDVSGAIGGSGGFVKVGTGTMNLTAANNFTGAASIAEGTVTAGAAGALGSPSRVTVNGGGTLLLGGAGDRIGAAVPVTLAGGTFHTAGLTESLGVLTLTADSIIDLAAGASLLNFADSSGASWVSTARLSIWNWTGVPVFGGGTDQLRFGTAPGSLTTSQLAQIDFYSGAGTGQIGAGSIFTGSFGEIVPVPEPSGVSLALALLGLGVWRERRQTQARRRTERQVPRIGALVAAAGTPQLRIG